VRVAAVAVLSVLVVAFFAVRGLDDAVAAPRPEDAAFRAPIVASIELAVVTLFDGRLHDAVPTVRTLDTTWGASSVLAQVDAVVALLPRRLRDHAVAAVRAARLAVRPALAVFARVPRGAVVAHFIRRHD